MSLIGRYREELRKYMVLKNKVNSIINELSFAIDNIDDVSNEIKSKYLINDNYTPVVSKSENLKNNLETIYRNLNDKVMVSIDLNIRKLNSIIDGLEKEQQNNGQDTI